MPVSIYLIYSAHFEEYVNFFLLFIYFLAIYFIWYSILFFFVTYRVGYPIFQNICWTEMAMDFGAHAALADYVVDATEALSFRSVGDHVIRV